MKKACVTMRFALLAIGICLSLTAIANKAKIAPAKLVVLTDKAIGKPVSANVRDTLVVRLAANITTGYNWTLAPLKGKVLIPIGKPVYEAPKTQMPGAGGISVFAFRAVALGKVKLMFSYARSWEKKAPAKTAEFSVVVKK